MTSQVLQFSYSCKSFRIGLILATLTSILVLSGCATPANKAAMSIAKTEQLSRQAQFQGAFIVGTVVGGQETNPLWTSQVSSESFKSALEESLRNIDYFSPGGGRFTIDANLKKLDQPLFGLTLDVTSEVIYRIEGMGYTRTIEVSAVGTATPSDAFIAIERLRIANERSIKNNITDFINQIDRDRRLIGAVSTGQKTASDVRTAAISTKCVELGFPLGEKSHQTCMDKLSK